VRVTIDGRDYFSKTAAGLIDEIKGMHFQAGESATAEDYIAVQERMFRNMTGRTMELPEADTEARAEAMFQAIAQIGAWDFSKEV